MRRLIDGIQAVFKTERRQSVFFTLILFAVGWGLAATYSHSLFPISEPLFQSLAALVIGTFWVERLFTPPRDALANAFAGLVFALSLLRDPTYVPPLLTGLTIYFGIVLVSAAFASWRQRGDAPEPFGRAYDLTYAFAVSGGRASVVYSLAFLATLTPLANASDEYALASFLVFWVTTVSLPHFIRQLGRLLGQEPKQHVGLVTSATSPMNVEALIPKAEILSVGDLVGIEDTCRLCNHSHPLTCYGRVLNVLSDSQIPQGAQRAQIQIYGAWHTHGDCVRKKNPLGLFEVADVLGVGQRIVRFSDLQGLPDQVQELPVFARHDTSVGYVLDRSSVEKLRFAIYPHQVVRRGNVVGVTLPGTDLAPQPVYYQVLDVATSDEEPTRPPFAMQYASAVQIGTVEAGGRFRTYDLTPYVRTPVWLEQEIPQRDEVEASRSIGVLPGTNIPVNVDFNALVAYHTAILGTTGSGKTTLLRTLLPKVASQGIKVLVIDSHDEFKTHDGVDTRCVLTVRSPDVSEAFKAFVESPELKTLLTQVGSKESDLEAAQKEIQEYVKQTPFGYIKDVWTKRESLTTSGKDKAVKRILDEFTQGWYPRSYLVRKPIENEDTDCLSVLDQWYAQSGNWNRPILIMKLHNLSIDEQRWIVGLVAERLFGLALEGGLTQFIPETGDPRARLCLVVEEAHIFAPERGFSIGTDENARRYCEGELRNLMLQARKYGVGAIVASQRSAFIDKGVLSQCNTLFAMKTVSINDKRVFEDFMDSDWVRLVTYLGTPPESPQAILVGKAAASSMPLIIEYEVSFPGEAGQE
ncbi:MAG TPA: ATP-binding protein [Anaerolineae bacterium]|nr:ATP-binding protein [Anaerolineae bacterium]